MPAGYALDDGAALNFVGGDMTEAVTSRPDAHAYYVRRENGGIVEQSIQTRFL